MHLTVGYLATPTGDDGVALAGALAKTFDAQVDVILVVREELPDGHPGRAEYQHFLIERGEEWISKAIDALAAKGVSATSTVLVGESYAESLIEFAQKKTSDLIVIGGARDGMLRRPCHRLGGRRPAAPLTVPVALAPRGYAEDPPDAVSAVTAAVPTRAGDDNPLPFAITLASAGRLPSEWCRWCRRRTSPRRRTSRNCAQMQVAAAEENCAVAARALPDAPEIDRRWPTA